LTDSTPTSGAPGLHWCEVHKDGVVVDTDRPGFVFVQAAAPSFIDEAFEPWWAWQAELAGKGHPVQRLTLPRTTIGALALDGLCEALADAAARSDSTTLVVRLDAAPVIFECVAGIAEAYARTVVATLPLWPSPVPSELKPLSMALASTPAAMSMDALSIPGLPMPSLSLQSLYQQAAPLTSAWFMAVRHGMRELLGQWAASPAGLMGVQGWTWQERLARQPLPSDEWARAWAPLVGSLWLWPGILSMLTDDWALRAAQDRWLASNEAADHLPNLAIVFSASRTADNQVLAAGMALELFGTVCAEPEALLIGDELWPALSAEPAATDSPIAHPPPKLEVVKAAPKPRKTSRAAAADDLTRIEGIGPKIAGILVQNGVTTFAELAQQAPSQIQTWLDAAGTRFGLARPDTWPQQAQLLADGDIEGFDALTARLKGGVEAA
jgi:predicted flap endonuclease-1-like 5' DNA nuclease